MANGTVVHSKKHPIISEFRELSSLKGRFKELRFVVEGLTLVERAVHDKLPVDRILYTPDLLANDQGPAFLDRAVVANFVAYEVSSGLMGTISTTRPVPAVIASVRMNYQNAVDLDLSAGSALLIADSIANPDNLGMVLRTAEAAAVDSVVFIGEGASPFHKNCVRAARGAVGRSSLAYCESPEVYFRQLIAAGFEILGATARANKNLYDFELAAPLALVVGNENEGIREEILELCTNLVKIPMAPGQSSLNVAVATGIILYELARHRGLHGEDELR
jgi:TrmH family RNA methyltransferase